MLVAAPVTSPLNGTRPAALEAPRARGARPHGTSLVVLLLALIVTSAAVVATAMQHNQTEDRLIDQRTKEAAAVLTAAVTNVRTPLTAAAELAEATDADVAVFDAVMRPITGTGLQFVSASLWAIGGPYDSPIASIGEPLQITTSGPARVKSMIDQATRAEQLATIDILDKRRLGFAVASSASSARYVVYAENTLPNPPRTARSSGAFEGLDYALYFGDAEATDHLLYSSVDVPITTRHASAVVPVGDTNLLLVMTPTANLAGNLSAWLPWMIAGAGLLLALGAALLSERLLRRRDHAVALAADNARLYDEQHEIAHTLQASLLPTRLIAPPGTTIAARYWPADTGSEVGGDFYDAFAIDEQRWGIAIGDVCGKGVHAAALTGVARHTMRATAAHLASPAAVLHSVHRAILAHDGDTFCTVCFVVVTPTPGGGVTLDLVLGGHPHPIVVRASGTVEEIGVPGTVLGMIEPSLTDQHLDLAPGDLLLMYTDGLTDAPHGEAVELETLVHRLEAEPHRTPDEIAAMVRSLIEERRPLGSGDDTAILVLSIG